MTEGDWDRHSVAWLIASSREATELLGNGGAKLVIDESDFSEIILPADAAAIAIPGAQTDVDQWIANYAVDPNIHILFVPALEQDQAVTILPDQIAAAHMSLEAALDITFAADSLRTGLTVIGSSDSMIEFQSDKNISVTLENGNDNTLITAAGADTINYNNGGNIAISTNGGNDTINLQGSGSVSIDSGADDDVINLDAEATIAGSIDGGAGFNHLITNGVSDDYSYTLNSSQISMHNSAGSELGLDNINLVIYSETGTISPADNITVLAANADESLIASLYEVVLGRTALDDPADGAASCLEGLKFWTEAAPGMSSEHLVRSFMNCPEIQQQHGKQTDAQFVESMYANLNNVAGTAVDVINGHSAEEYAELLESGKMERYEVAWEIADSAETSLLLGASGANYVIEADI